MSGELTTALAVEAVAWERAPRYPGRNVNRRIVCADGFAVSVQASATHYANDSRPAGETASGLPSNAPYWRDLDDQDADHPFVTFEVGYLTADPTPAEVWDEYDSDGVWAWVPRQVVADLLDAHGGAVKWEAPVVSAKGPHPFDPTMDGRACRVFVEYVDHRPVMCGAERGADVHTGTRRAPNDLEFPPPPCSVCDKDTDHDGDGFRCYSCGASWSSDGRGGEWDEPEVKVCTSTHKPFDRDDLAPEHEKIRHFIKHCILPADHDDRHDGGDFTKWDDDQEVSA